MVRFSDYWICVYRFCLRGIIEKEYVVELVNVMFKNS